MYIHEAVIQSMEEGYVIKRKTDKRIRSYRLNNKRNTFDIICPMGQETMIFKNWRPTPKDLVANDWEVVKG